MNSENGETTDPDRLLLKFLDKIDLSAINAKIWKSHTETINLKGQLQRETKNLS